MDKVYLKNGNTEKKGNKQHYCKDHFIEIYKREPNIQDVATPGFCYRCRKVSPNEWD